MVIEFDPAIFESLAHANNFLFLLNLCYIDRRYDLFIDIPSIKESELYGQLSQGDKFIIDEYYKAVLTTGGQSDFAVSITSDEETFNLVEAREFFNQPVSIIVENSLNDKPFLETIASIFAKQGKKIKRHLGLRWISVDNGGGCGNIANVIREQLSTFQGRPKSPQSYLRCFVLVDSDSTFPGEESTERQGLKDFLIANGISFHILIKREMENYLPDEAIAAVPDNEILIAAYLKMNPHQKDHFDLQKGFTKNLQSYPEGVQLLYADISDADITTFRKGGIKMANFKSDFPKMFLTDKVTRESLQERIAHQGANANELEIILEKINELL